MPAFPVQTRMLLTVERLLDFAQIGVHNYCTIYSNFDAAAVGDDFLLIPLTDRFESSTRGRNKPIDRAVLLVWLQVFIFRMAVVENLNFQAGVSGMSFSGGADADAVVSAGRKFEFKPQNEIAVFFDCIKIFSATDKRAVFNGPTLDVALPAGVRLAVEERHETFLDFLRRQRRRIAFVSKEQESGGKNSPSQQ